MNKDNKEECRTVDIRVITKPVTVELDCPYCDAGLEWEYTDFIGIVGDVCDWMYSKLTCPCCNEVFEIDQNEWL